MSAIQLYQQFDFDLISDGAVRGLRSIHSRRTYAATYGKWVDWCEIRGIHPLHLSGDHIEMFLVSQEVSYGSRKNQLSHMKKLVEYLITQHEGFEKFYKQINFIKISDEGTKESNRTKNFMTPSQVELILGYWLGLLESDRPALMYRRNQAIVVVALGTAARRSEIASLKWTDFNFEDGLVRFRKRKGGKSDTIPYLGEFVKNTLEWWRDYIPGNIYVFPPIAPDGNTVLEDKPVSPDTIYQTIKVMSAALGISMSPHDLRRTVATELGRNGVDLHNIQRMMGHASSTTTRIYMEDIDALELREKLSVRWDVS